ncbi:hypothetical protein [Dyella caseinilytica]|uniref:Uncharacterized protein n=1 Tax=Dyella caseinilytica TaxID=1849581 RepID=A0ABX7GZD0_9GAMM|nr:hypothetical protein [Dyella caseinilytica]QRN55378.1 hypothetical protein ISN74_08675 [Dyella caseinilytica]GGA01287.1 hypothetical protein GCM10011408_23160 [Dyella caseinilytica]
MRLHILLYAALLASTQTFASDCNLIYLTFAKNSATAGSVTVTIEDEPDNVPYNVDNPQAWVGPVKISVGGQPACTASESVSIVENPVLLGRDVLYVATYSGSERTMYALDTKTCRIVWKSPIFFGNSIYSHGVLHLGKHGVLLNKMCRPVVSKPFPDYQE